MKSRAIANIRAPMDGPEVERIHRVRERLYARFASLDEMFAYHRKLEKNRKRNIDRGRREMAERDAERRREAARAKRDAELRRKAALAVPRRRKTAASRHSA